MKQSERKEYKTLEMANCQHVSFTSYTQTGEGASFYLDNVIYLPEELLWTPLYFIEDKMVSKPLFCEVVDCMERCTKIPYVTPEELWQMVEGRQFRLERTEGMLRPDDNLLNNYCSTDIQSLLLYAILRGDTRFIGEHTIPATQLRFVELI